MLQARAVLGIAIGEFYPQVQQGSGSLIYNRTSAATPLAAPNSSPSRFWTNSLVAQAAWELDFWGKFRRGVESADAAYLASIATYDQVLVSLLGDVAATYIGIRTTEQLIAVARDNVRKEVEALKIARAKYEGGSTSELDVFQATSVLDAVRSAIPQLEIQLEQGRNALCVLLGIPPQPLGQLLGRSRGIPTPPYTIAVGIPADLLRRRPDIRAAELAALGPKRPDWHCRNRSFIPRSAFPERSAPLPARLMVTILEKFLKLLASPMRPVRPSSGIS